MEPLAMILGLASMLVANAACLLGAHALWRRCRTGRPATDAALFLLIRFALASSAVLAAGLAGVLSGGALGLAGAAVLGGLLLLGEHRHVRLPDRRDVPPIPPLLLGIGALFGIRLLVQVWFLAPHTGDSISYHLPKLAEWIQAGRITAETGNAWRSAFPGGFEFFEIWWCVFLRHDLLIEMAGVETWAMAFAAMFAVARACGLNPHGAFLAALLFGSTPVVVMQAAGCLNDLAVVALYLTAFALVLARAHPLLLLLPVAVGIGVKPTLGFAMPGLILLAALLRKEPAAPRPASAPAASLAVLALGLGAYWYVRNWVIYGNPIHPGTRDGFFEGQLAQQVGPNLMSLKESLRRIIDSRIYDSLRGYNAQCDFAANWGPAVFAAGLPGLLLALRDGGGRFRAVALGIGASAASVLLLVLSDPWFTRFVIFIPALLCIAAARLGLAVRGVSVILAACIGYQFIGTLATDRMAAMGEYPALYRQSWRERASDMIGPGLPAGERAIAACGKGDYEYLLYGPDFSRKVHYLREKTAEAIAEQMRSRGLGVVYATAPMVAELEAGARRKVLKRVAGNFFSLPEWTPVTSPSGTP